MSKWKQQEVAIVKEYESVEEGVAQKIEYLPGPDGPSPSGQVLGYAAKYR